MVNFKKLADRATKARAIVEQQVEKQGGTDALKAKAEKMKDAAKGPGSMSDKAKAAAAVAKEKPNPAAPTPADSVGTTATPAPNPAPPAPAPTPDPASTEVPFEPADPAPPAASNYEPATPTGAGEPNVDVAGLPEDSPAPAKDVDAEDDVPTKSASTDK